MYYDIESTKQANLLKIRDYHKLKGQPASQPASQPIHALDTHILHVN